MLDRPAVLCPCCNRPMEAPFAPVTSLADGPFSYVGRRILERLARAYPAPVSVKVLLNYVYLDDPNGGPDNSSAVHKGVRTLRKRLPAYGWTIPPGTAGHASQGYRLEPVRTS